MLLYKKKIFPLKKCIVIVKVITSLMVETIKTLTNTWSLNFCLLDFGSHSYFHSGTLSQSSAWNAFLTLLA